jgi:hypothetical protein
MTSELHGERLGARRRVDVQGDEDSFHACTSRCGEVSIAPTSSVTC